MRTHSLASSGVHRELTSCGLYSARFGHFARWPLADLLGELARQTISVREERAAVEQLFKRWAFRRQGSSPWHRWGNADGRAYRCRCDGSR